MALVREYSAGVVGHHSSLSLISHIQALDLFPHLEDGLNEAEEGEKRREEGASEAGGDLCGLTEFNGTLGVCLCLPMDEKFLRTRATGTGHQVRTELACPLKTVSIAFK